MRSVNTGDVSLSKLSFLPSQPQPASAPDDVTVRTLLSHVNPFGSDAMNDSALDVWTSKKAPSAQPSLSGSGGAPEDGCPGCKSSTTHAFGAGPHRSARAASEQSENAAHEKMMGEKSRAAASNLPLKEQSVPAARCPSSGSSTGVTCSDAHSSRLIGGDCLPNERSHPDCTSSASEGFQSPAAPSSVKDASLPSAKPDPSPEQFPAVPRSQLADASLYKSTRVELPERYRHVLTRSGSYASIGYHGNSSSSNQVGSNPSGNQDLTSREKDLGTALAWIRNEMVQMKEQDKVLLKRFIELRATILQLRCMYDILGSASDLRMDGSCVSLNEVRMTPRMRSIVRTDSGDLVSGGKNLYKAASSLSLPCSPQLTRLRWQSDELM